MTLITSPLLASIPWLEHGFGTRDFPESQEGMASLKQIHSKSVMMADSTGCLGQGDALLTQTEGLAVSIRTADCLPILLADTESRVVAAVHAGWRGTWARIAVEALDRLHAEYGTRPENVYAAIGPGIGACCYHVGEDVAVRFGMNSAAKLDLASHNLRQLTEAGVPAVNVNILGLCTHCDPMTFHSFRRDKESAGRMISFIRVIKKQ